MCCAIYTRLHPDHWSVVLETVHGAVRRYRRRGGGRGGGGGGGQPVSHRGGCRFKARIKSGTSVLG